MSCGDISGNIGFIEEDKFPLELKDACLDYFAHEDGVDLTYLGQKSPGHYTLLCRDTRQKAELYLVDLTRRPSAFEKLSICR